MPKLSAADEALLANLLGGSGLSSSPKAVRAVAKAVAAEGRPKRVAHPSLAAWRAAAAAHGYGVKGGKGKLPAKGTAEYNAIRATYDGAPRAPSVQRQGGFVYDPDAIDDGGDLVF